MRVRSVCSSCLADTHTGSATGGACECVCHQETVAEVLTGVRESLVTIAAPLADRVLELVNTAVRTDDYEAVRREGHLWSGRIGLELLLLADRIEDLRIRRG